MTLGQTIRAARESRHLTAEALASLVGVSMNTVVRWERDEIEASRERLEQIAAALGMRVRVDVEFIMEESDDAVSVIEEG